MTTRKQAGRFRARVAAGDRPPVPGDLAWLLGWSPAAIRAEIARARAFEYGNRAAIAAARLRQMGILDEDYAMTETGREYADADPVTFPEGYLGTRYEHECAAKGCLDGVLVGGRPYDFIDPTRLKQDVALQLAGPEGMARIDADTVVVPAVTPETIRAAAKHLLARAAPADHADVNDPRNPPMHAKFPLNVQQAHGLAHYLTQLTATFPLDEDKQREWSDGVGVAWKKLKAAMEGPKEKDCRPRSHGPEFCESQAGAIAANYRGYLDRVRRSRDAPRREHAGFEPQVGKLQEPADVGWHLRDFEDDPPHSNSLHDPDTAARSDPPKVLLGFPAERIPGLEGHLYRVRRAVATTRRDFDPDHPDEPWLTLTEEEPFLAFTRIGIVFDTPSPSKPLVYDLLIDGPVPIYRARD